jgi:hypothetical protein
MVPLDLRLRRSTVVAAGLSALVVAGWAVSRATPELSLPRAPGPPPAATAEERVVVGPLQNRSGAWLTVGDAAARIRVRFAPLPGLLYRISTSSDAGVAPVVSHRDGRVLVRLRATGRSGLDELRIVLNRAVRWDLRFPKGAGEQQLNLRDGRVTRVDVGSAGLAEVWLPDPDGTVPVNFLGGIGTAMLSLRDGSPVRVRLGEGAGSVEAPWTTNNGTAAGTVLREPGFQQSRDRYAVRAEAGLGALIIKRAPKAAAGSPEPGRPSGADQGPGRATVGEPGSRRPAAGGRDPGDTGGGATDPRAADGRPAPERPRSEAPGPGRVKQGAAKQDGGKRKGAEPGQPKAGASQPKQPKRATPAASERERPKPAAPKPAAPKPTGSKPAGSKPAAPDRQKPGRGEPAPGTRTAEPKPS